MLRRVDLELELLLLQDLGEHVLPLDLHLVDTLEVLVLELTRCHALLLFRCRLPQCDQPRHAGTLNQAIWTTHHVQ